MPPASSCCRKLLSLGKPVLGAFHPGSHVCFSLVAQQAPLVPRPLLAVPPRRSRTAGAQGAVLPVVQRMAFAEEQLF